MSDRENEPKSRQEKKAKGKFTKKRTDEKYTKKHARAYERLMDNPLKIHF